MNGNTENIREPAVAGQFYDADPLTLRKQLEKFFAECAHSDVPSNQKLTALISPHAGYVYSGRTAAETFSRISTDAAVKRVFIIAPSHRIPFSGIALADYAGYKTPLGTLKIDTDTITGLAQYAEFSIMNEAHEGEHALEVQLPFLQMRLPQIPIVPLICGRLNKSSLLNTAQALLPYLNNETLWIISSDFTHFGASFGYVPFTDNVPRHLRELDMGAIEKITAVDYKGFSDYTEETGATICGSTPIKLLLKTMELTGERSKFTSELVKYTNSGELTGDFSHCVSYAGIAFYTKSEKIRKEFN